MMVARRHPDRRRLLAVAARSRVPPAFLVASPWSSPSSRPCCCSPATPGSADGWPTVVVLDYGSGNIRSAQRALERVGADVTVTSDTAQRARRRRAGRARRRCLRRLHDRAARRRRRRRHPRAAGRRPAGARHLRRHADPVRQRRRARHATRLASACSRARVDRLEAPVLPHMGWNTLEPPAAARCSPASRTSGSTSSTPTPRSRPRWPTTRRWAEHGSRFVAAVERGRLRAPRSSTPRSPATPEPTCSRTG